MTRESISSREHSHITHNIYTLPALQIFIAARSFSSSYLRRVRGTSSNRDAPSVSVQCTQCLIESSCLFLSFFFSNAHALKRKNKRPLIAPSTSRRGRGSASFFSLSNIFLFSPLMRQYGRAARVSPFKTLSFNRVQPAFISR